MYHMNALSRWFTCTIKFKRFSFRVYVTTRRCMFTYNKCIYLLNILPSCWILPFLINIGSTTTTVHLRTHFPPCKVRTSSTCLNNCIKVAIGLLRSFSSQFCVGIRWSGISMAAHVVAISVLCDPGSYSCSCSTVISNNIHINQWTNISVVHIRVIITLLKSFSLKVSYSSCYRDVSSTQLWFCFSRNRSTLSNSIFSE